MKFEMNQAWRDAAVMIGENGVTLSILAGVFVFVPRLASTFAFADYQSQSMADLRSIFAGQPRAVSQVTTSDLLSIYLVSLVAMLIGFVGYLSMTAVLAERDRPNVVGAVLKTLKYFPSLIVATMVVLIVYAVGLVAVGLAIGALSVGLGAGSVFLVIILVILYLLSLLFLAAKFALIMPVMVYERRLNPFGALARAWRLTSGNSWRLFGFFILLTLVYVAIVGIATGSILAAFSAAIAEGSTVARIASGVFGGLLGAAVSIASAAIIVAIYRQLAGPTDESLVHTFE